MSGKKDQILDDVDMLGDYVRRRFDIIAPDVEGGSDAARDAKYALAAGEANEGAMSISEGARLIAQGNTLAGVGMVLRGIGSVVSAMSSMVSMLGPMGPIFSVITGVIAAILKFFEPEEKSLADQIKDIVGQNSLDEVRKDLAADDATWQIMTGGLDADGKIARIARTRQAITFAANTQTTFTFKADEMAWPLGYDDDFRYKPDQTLRTAAEKLAAEAADLKVGMSWERIQEETHIETHLKFMLGAIAFLGGFKGEKTSEEWVDLCNATGAYTLKFWLYIHQFVGVVSPDGLPEFMQMRRNLVETLMDAKAKDDIGSAVREIIAAVQRNGTLYSRWAATAQGTFDTSYNQIGRRDGVVTDVGDWVWDSGSVTSNFAVASSGTQFACSTSGKPAAGRGGTWIERDELPFGTEDADACTEVFIGEPAGLTNSVIVAYRDAGASRSRFALCAFDDAAGTLDQKRWGPWHTWTFDYLRLASVAFAAPTPGGGDGYEIYVLGLLNDMRVILYQLWWDGTLKEVDGFSWTAAEVQAARPWNLSTSTKSPLSCAISLDPFAVQVGNSVKIRGEGGAIAAWDLAKFIDDAALKTHHARFYGDRTFMAYSNRGLHLRRWDPQDGYDVWDHDFAIETPCAQKVPMAEGSTWIDLMQQIDAIHKALEKTANGT